MKKSKQELNLSTYKINIVSLRSSKIKEAYRYLSNKYKDDIEISYTHPLLLEITKKGINKG
jgi:hydroxymethylpyrimidine pyrophosphatase-like HAD family hydrolase